MLRFDLNVSILLKEYPFLQRFDHAARLRFDAVEFWWPTGEDLQAVVQHIRDAGLQVAISNFNAGNMAAGDRGLLNDPQRQAEFRANVPVALDLAHQLGCSKLNALVGTWRRDEKRESQLKRVRENLYWAAEQAHAAGITILVEALNTWENGPYILSSTVDTLQLIASVGAPNIQYQYDVYHMQRMEGNIIATLREHIAKIGHIQVADSPDRHEPGTGELNYRNIFSIIVASGYKGRTGIEYNPGGSAEDSLQWLPPDRERPIAVHALNL
jgi:hydroxypyruvate isomerase